MGEGSKGKQKVGPVEDLPEGEFFIREIGGQDVGLLRLAKDRVFALRNVCPHRGAPICKGQVSGTMLPSPPGGLLYGHDAAVVRCPWHGYEFDLQTGAPLFDSFRAKVKTFRTEIRDGDLWVDLG